MTRRTFFGTAFAAGAAGMPGVGCVAATLRAHREVVAMVEALAMDATRDFR